MFQRDRLDRYDSIYNKLLRVVAYVQRFTHNCRRQKCDRRSGPITADESQEAERLLIRDVQTSSFAEEIKSLKSGKSNQPLVRQLRLYLDEADCVRCGGRIHNAPVTDTTKFPYLLPKFHQMTRLIVRHAHEHIKHSGLNATVTLTKQILVACSRNQDCRFPTIQPQSYELQKTRSSIASGLQGPVSIYK